MSKVPVNTPLPKELNSMEFLCEVVMKCIDSILFSGHYPTPRKPCPPPMYPLYKEKSKPDGKIGKSRILLCLSPRPSGQHWLIVEGTKSEVKAPKGTPRSSLNKGRYHKSVIVCPLNNPPPISPICPLFCIDNFLGNLVVIFVENIDVSRYGNT